MLKLRFIGRGMYMEFHHPTYPRIVTSRVVDIRACRSSTLPVPQRRLTDRPRSQDLLRHMKLPAQARELVSQSAYEESGVD